MQKAVFFITILLCFYLSGCVSVKQPLVVGVNNFKLSEIAPNTKLKFDVLIKNPNNFGLTLQKMNVEVFLQDSLVSVVGLNSKIKVAAKAETAIPFTVTPKVAHLPQLALFGLGQFLKKDNPNYKIKGVLVVRKSLLRKKYGFVYP